MLVKFVECSDYQVKWKGHADPRECLVIGEVYRISQKNVYESYTDIYLEGFGTKRFNSVCFEELDENFSLINHIERMREFSLKTFGPGEKIKPVINHIKKELVEIEENPKDLYEWIDVILLALDGAWRSGASPEQIVEVLQEKQNIVEARTWPDWRTLPDDATIEHDRTGEQISLNDEELKTNHLAKEYSQMYAKLENSVKLVLARLEENHGKSWWFTGPHTDLQDAAQKLSKLVPPP